MEVFRVLTRRISIIMRASKSGTVSGSDPSTLSFISHDDGRGDIMLCTCHVLWDVVCSQFQMDVRCRCCVLGPTQILTSDNSTLLYCNIPCQKLPGDRVVQGWTVGNRAARDRP